jgi:hypothetical protein
MATKNLPQDLTTTADGSLLLSDERVETMRRAMYETQALHELLAGVLYPLHDVATEHDRVTVRRQAEALLRRMAECNSIVMSGLDDPMEGAAELESRLQGALPKTCMEAAAHHV